MVRDDALSICWFMLGRTEIKNYMQSILYHVLSSYKISLLNLLGICQTKHTLHDHYL